MHSTHILLFTKIDDNKLEQELIFDTLRTYEHERNISLDISSYSDGNPFLNTYIPGDFDLIFMVIADIILYKPARKYLGWMVTNLHNAMICMFTFP